MAAHECVIVSRNEACSIKRDTHKRVQRQKPLERVASVGIERRHL